MIELVNVWKSYETPAGPNVVLHDVSFTFPERESIGILGKNGAGKSTLLRILGGVEQPDSGRANRLGRVSWPIGFSGGFSASLSGEENCRFVARIYGENADRVVAYAQEFAELGTYFQMPIRTYSSGMRARLAFGLSMAIDFDVYLVDEVTAVGDARFAEKCKEAFTGRKAHASMIIVSHNLATISTYCQRCAVLDSGKLHLYDDLQMAGKAYKRAQLVA